MRKILALIVLPVGLFFLFGVSKEFYTLFSSYLWSSVDGEIISSQVSEEKCYKKCKINADISECNKQQVCYRPLVNYKFIIPEFGEVRSSVISQSNYDGNRSKNIADSVVKKYYPGKKLNVIYSIKNNKVTSFIERKINILYISAALIFSISFIYASINWFSGKKL